jgi:hypothetical protein
LQRLEFECGLFGGSLLLGLEVATDADAVEVAIDAEREHAVPVLKRLTANVVWWLTPRLPRQPGNLASGFSSSEEKSGGEGGIRTSQAQQPKSLIERAFELLRGT